MTTSPEPGFRAAAALAFIIASAWIPLPRLLGSLTLATIKMVGALIFLVLVVVWTTVIALIVAVAALFTVWISVTHVLDKIVESTENNSALVPSRGQIYDQLDEGQGGNEEEVDM